MARNEGVAHGGGQVENIRFSGYELISKGPNGAQTLESQKKAGDDIAGVTN